MIQRNEKRELRKRKREERDEEEKKEKKKRKKKEKKKTEEKNRGKYLFSKIISLLWLNKTVFKPSWKARIEPADSRWSTQSFILTFSRLKKGNN